MLINKVIKFFINNHKSLENKRKNRVMNIMNINKNNNKKKEGIL